MHSKVNNWSPIWFEFDIHVRYDDDTTPIYFHRFKIKDDATVNISNPIKFNSVVYIYIYIVCLHDTNCQVKIVRQICLCLCQCANIINIYLQYKNKYTIQGQMATYSTAWIIDMCELFEPGH